MSEPSTTSPDSPTWKVSTTQPTDLSENCSRARGVMNRENKAIDQVMLAVACSTCPSPLLDSDESRESHTHPGKHKIREDT